MHPVKHSEELPILTPPDSYQLDRDESNSDEDAARDVSDADFHPEKSDWPHLINQSELSWLEITTVEFLRARHHNFIVQHLSLDFSTLFQHGWGLVLLL